MKLAFLVVMSLLAFSCSSSKPKTNAETIVAESDQKFVLNGDSDSNSAGGLETIYFDYQSDRLSTNGKLILNENIKMLNANPKVEIQVEGHCDERGGRQFNLALGERRAKTVRSYLIANGIGKNRIKTVSYGNERPVEHVHNEAAWMRNRRANFVIIAK